MEYRLLSDAEYEDLGSRILYEDNHILAVNKRVGEITQGDKTGDECLSDEYKAYIAMRDGKQGKVFLGVPHRLDRPVCGVCLLAKTSKALSRLTEMFREGEINKKYLALCCSRPKKDEALLENLLVRNEKQNKSYVLEEGSGSKAPRKDAKMARLKYRYLLSTERYHLLEVTLLSGRHHQIRCQLGHIGCPIKGDLKYGAPRSNPDGGISLQAHEISFTHPVKKVPVDIVAPVPSDWKGVSEGGI